MSTETLENKPQQKSGRAIALPAPSPPRSLISAFTKSFVWLVCRVVGLFTPREKPLQQAACDFR